MVKESSRGTISSLMTPSKCFNFCNDISPACATCPETPCIRPRARDRGWSRWVSPVIIFLSARNSSFRAIWLAVTMSRYNRHDHDEPINKVSLDKTVIGSLHATRGWFNSFMEIISRIVWEEVSRTIFFKLFFRIRVFLDNLRISLT